MNISHFLSFFSATSEMRKAKKIVREISGRNPRTHKRIFLIEAFQTPSNRLGLAAFAPIASSYYQADLASYYMMPSNLFVKLKEIVRFSFSVEKAFGCRKFITIGSRPNRSSYIRLAKNLVANIENKYDFEKLSYKGIRVGDLLYDVYLRRSQNPTLNFEDPILISTISEFLQYFDKLLNFFERKVVAGVCVSHTVYFLGLPSRMAAHFDVPSFQVTAESIHRITSEWTHAYTAFKQYPEIFSSLDKQDRELGKRLAEKRLLKRFGGEIGVDMSYSTASAFSNPKDSVTVLRNSNKPKVLVAIHDFFDSPHSYGDNLYPDFYEWLLDLARISQEIDYDWYIKTHPDIQGSGNQVLREFTEKYPNFTVIPSETSHHNLISEGITVALTIFGSIAMEYPYLGVPVINASQNNPHVRYSFCLSPKDREEYQKLLLNIPKSIEPSSREQILEYYFVHNILMLKSWFFIDYEHYFKGIGGSKFAYSWPIFREYFKSDNSIPLPQISSSITNFLNSSDQCLGRHHFPKNSSVSLGVYLRQFDNLEANRD